jgi:hypothetical protein
MTSLTMILFICTGLGGEGSVCDNYTVTVTVSPLVYEAVCIKQPNTGSDWAVMEDTLGSVAHLVDSPSFVLESIDCLGE